MENQLTKAQKVDMCVKFLIKTMIDTNADEMIAKQEGFSFQNKILGDYEVVVRKLK